MGAQSIYDVLPDLTCFGKALAGGMPVGAYGGKKEFDEPAFALWHRLPGWNIFW